MKKKIQCILLLVLIVMLSGCARKTMVVLVPDPEGTTGRITVSNQAGSVEIETPNQATTIKDSQTEPSTPTNIEKKTIDTIFSEALSIQPPLPVHFLLYFDKDVNLTPDSSKRIADILAAIRARNSIDVSVIGHADTAGNTKYNLKLSKRRAAAVGNILAEQGVKPNYISTTSHGEENLLIKTADNVVEPRNRRVEVVVR